MGNVVPPQIIEMVEQNGLAAVVHRLAHPAAIRTAAEPQEAGIRIHLSPILVAGDSLDIEPQDIFAQRLALLERQLLRLRSHEQ